MEFTKEEKDVLLMALRHYITDTSEVGWAEQYKKATTLYMKLFIGEGTK